jgi:hypothetical protein
MLMKVIKHNIKKFYKSEHAKRKLEHEHKFQC